MEQQLVLRGVQLGFVLGPVLLLAVAIFCELRIHVLLVLFSPLVVVLVLLLLVIVIVLYGAVRVCWGERACVAGGVLAERCVLEKIYIYVCAVLSQQRYLWRNKMVELSASEV